MRQFLLTALIVSLAAGSGRADSLDVDSTKSQPGVDTTVVATPADSFVLSIERNVVAWPLVEDTIDITVQGTGSFAGFDLSVAIGTVGYDIASTLPGDIIAECGWELFNARDKLMELPDGRVLRTWKIIGLADVMPDTNRPACVDAPEPISLARLVIRGEAGVPSDAGAVPVYFVWGDCGDNSLSDTSGNVLMISERVSHYVRPGRELSQDIFPNFTGAPNQCLSPERPGRILRTIEFRSGGLEVRVPVDSAIGK